MDESTERELHLQQLARKALSGEMSEAERQEYDVLRNEQSAQRDRAIAEIAKRRVLRSLLPWLAILPLIIIGLLIIGVFGIMDAARNWTEAEEE